MSQRRALEAWQRARAVGFSVVALPHRGPIAHGPQRWRRFLDGAGVAELRAVVAALDRLHHPPQTAGPAGGATAKG